MFLARRYDVAIALNDMYRMEICAKSLLAGKTFSFQRKLLKGMEMYDSPWHLNRAVCCFKKRYVLLLKRKPEQCDFLERSWFPADRRFGKK